MEFRLSCRTHLFSSKTSVVLNHKVSKRNLEYFIFGIKLADSFKQYQTLKSTSMIVINNLKNEIINVAQ